MIDNFNENGSEKLKKVKKISFLPFFMGAMLSFQTQVSNALDNNYGDNFYNNQKQIINNNPKIKTAFINLINDYLETQKDTEKSNLFLSGIIGKAKKLSKNDFNNLTNHIYSLVDTNSKEDDKMQLLNLWSTLQNIDYKEIGEDIESENDLDFEITGGTIEVKTFSIKHKGGFKFEKGKTRNVKYEITDEEIISLGENKYKIFLKREKFDRVREFIIKYKGGYSFVIYDEKGRYIGRQTVETKEKIIMRGNKNYREIYKTPGKLTIDTKYLKIKLNIIFNK